MWYRKNIYRWESILRMAAGIGLAVYALLGMTGSVVAYLLMATGAAVALTGLVGWCPMCAMVGRKLNRPLE